MRLKKNDSVVVISGKYKGKVGVITTVDRSSSKVFVSGVNVVQKSSKESTGGFLEKTMPLHFSNVAYYDSESSARTKVGYKSGDNNVKLRFSRKTGKMVDE